MGIKDYEFDGHSSKLLEYIERHLTGSETAGSHFRKGAFTDAKALVDFALEQIQHYDGERLEAELDLPGVIGYDGLVQLDDLSPSAQVTQEPRGKNEHMANVVRGVMAKPTKHMVVIAGPYGSSGKHGIYTIFPGTMAPFFPQTGEQLQEMGYTGQELETQLSEQPALQEFWDRHGLIAAGGTIEEQLYARPEVQALESVIESNKYHTEKNALVHTHQVNEAMVDTLEFDGVTDQAVKARLQAYVSEPVGDYTRGELLRVATVLHDVGKAMVDAEDKPLMLVKENGDTTSPEHAKCGAEPAYEILKYMGFSEADASYVKDVVHSHMRIFNLYDSLGQAKSPQKIMDRTVKGLDGQYLDVLLHSRADLLGCDRRSDYSAKPLDFEGRTFTSDVGFVDYLIEQSMTIREETGSATGLERISGTAYIAPEQESLVRSELTSTYQGQMAGKVASGKIKAEIVPGIVAKRVDKVMQGLHIGEPSSDYQTVLSERPVKYTVI
jgi:hypothetical protein